MIDWHCRITLVKLKSLVKRAPNLRGVYWPDGSFTGYIYAGPWKPRTGDYERASYRLIVDRV